MRLNNPGRFALPPTRVEAMYAPESFGESPNRRHRGRAVIRAPAPRRSGVVRAGVALALAAACAAAARAADIRRGEGGAPPVRPDPRRSPRRAAPDRARRQGGAPPGVDAARRDVAGPADGDRPERGQALLGARRRRLAGGGDERLGQSLEHAHARRVDADDAARRPARRRAGAAERRPQRRPEARPGDDGGASRDDAGRRARSSRPISTRCRTAARSSASKRWRRRCSPSTRAASTRRRRRSPPRSCAARTRRRPTSPSAPAAC